MSLCILFKKTSDSNVTLLKDGLTINYLVSKQYMGIRWAKESFGYFLDAHVSVL